MSLLDYLKAVPFLRIVVPFGVGVYYSDFWDNGVWVLFVFASFAFLFLLLFLFNPNFYKKFSLRWLSGGTLIIFLFCFGLLWGYMSQPVKSDNQFEVIARAEVKEVYATSSGFLRLVVLPLEIRSNDSIPFRPSDLWQLTVEPVDSFSWNPVIPGSIIQFYTRLNGTFYENGNPETFTYGRYLSRQGISFSGFVDGVDFEVVGRKKHGGMKSGLADIRSKVYEIFKKYCTEEQSLQVLSALTLGMRHRLDYQVKEWFVRSGVIHVLAVSGLHVGIVFFILNYIFAIPFPGKNLIRLVLVVGGLFFYALLTGGSPSVYRASIMLSVIQVGKVLGRHGNIYNLLCLSAFIILLIEPLSLFNVGFWLSHLAVAGIVTFFPVFQKFYADRNLFVRRFCDLIAVSLAAQLGTFPVSLHVFRAFPTWFLLSNFFILPLVGPILILSLLLILFSGSPFLSMVVSGALNDLLTFMIEMIQWINGLPMAYESGLRIGAIAMVLIYFFMGSITGWMYFKKRRLFFASMVFGLLIVISLNVEYLLKRTTNALVVFKSTRETYIGLINKGRGVLFYDDSFQNNLEFVSDGFFAKYAFEYQKMPLLKENADDEIVVFSTPVGVFLALGEVDVSVLKVLPKRMDEIVGVVLFGNTRGDLAAFIKKIGCSQVIVAGGAPPWILGQIRGPLNKEEVFIHNVWDDGAFVKFY